MTWFSVGSEGEWPSSTKYSKEKTKEKQGQGNFVPSHSMILWCKSDRLLALSDSFELTNTYTERQQVLLQDEL